MALDSLNNLAAAARRYTAEAPQSAGPRPAAATPPGAAKDNFVSTRLDTRGWDLSAFQPPAQASRLPQAEADAKARDIFTISVPRSKAEAKQLGEFFARYPST